MASSSSAGSGSGGSSDASAIIGSFEIMYRQLSELQLRVASAGGAIRDMGDVDRFSRDMSNATRSFVQVASQEFHNLDIAIERTFNKASTLQKFDYDVRMTFRGLNDEITTMNDNMDQVFGRPRIIDMRRWERETDRVLDEVGDSGEKAFNRIGKSMDKVIGGAGTLSNLMTLGAVNDIKSALEQNLTTTIEIGDKIRNQLGLTAKEWTTLYASGMTTLRAMNKEFNYKFSDTDFFQSMNDLTTIGVRSTEELSKLTPQLTRFKKAIADFDPKNFQSFWRMYQEWGDKGYETGDLIADSVKKVSESFKVDTSTLLGTLDEYNGNFIEWSDGNIAKYKDIVDQFTAITTLSENNFMDSSQLLSTLKEIKSMSPTDLGNSDWTKTFGLIDMNIVEVQKRLANGDWDSVALDMMTGIGKALNDPSITSEQKNWLKSQMSLDSKAVTEIQNNYLKFADQMKDIEKTIANSAGTIDKTIQDQRISWLDRAKNWASTQEWYQKAQEWLIALDITPSGLLLTVLAFGHLGKAIGGMLKIGLKFTGWMAKVTGLSTALSKINPFKRMRPPIIPPTPPIPPSGGGGAGGPGNNRRTPSPSNANRVGGRPYSSRYRGGIRPGTPPTPATPPRVAPNGRNNNRGYVDRDEFIRRQSTNPPRRYGGGRRMGIAANVQVLDDIGNLGKKLFSGGKGLLSKGAGLFKGVGGIASGAGGGVGKGLLAGGKGLLKRLPVIGTALGVIGIGSQLAQGDSRGVVTSLGGILGGAGAGAAAGAALGSIVPGIGTAIGTIVGGVAGAIGGEKFTGWLYDNAGPAIDWMKDKYEGLKETGKAVWNKTTEFASSAWQKGQELAGVAGAAVGKVYGALKQTAIQAWNDPVGTAKKSWETYKQGAAMVKDFVGEKFESLKAKGLELWDKLKGAAGDAWGGIQGIWDTGPTWLGTKLGELAMKGVAAFKDIGKAASEMWNGVKENVTGFSKWIDLIHTDPNKASDQLKNKAQEWISKITGKDAKGNPIKQYAYGGKADSPHMGVFGEAGPEYLIPVGPDKKKRGTELWLQAGKDLGIPMHSEGGAFPGSDNKAASMGLTKTSGYRSSSKDAAVGGSGKGDHTRGLAADYAGSRKDMDAFAKWAAASGLFTKVIWNDTNLLTGTHIGGHQDHVHVSYSKTKIGSNEVGSGGKLNSAAASGGSLLDMVKSIISANEGSYTSVAASDNGHGMSIGKFQWHENRAKELLNMMRAANSSLFDSTIMKAGGSSLLAKLSWGSWDEVKATPSEASALKTVLGLKQFMPIQDQLMNRDLQSYIDAGKKAGLVDSKAIAYFADLYNQSPARAVSIAKSVGSRGTLADIHEAAMKEAVMGKYSSRRKATYQKLLSGNISGGNSTNSAAEGSNLNASGIDMSQYSAASGLDKMYAKLLSTGVAGKYDRISGVQSQKGILDNFNDKTKAVLEIDRVIAAKRAWEEAYKDKDKKRMKEANAVANKARAKLKAMGVATSEIAMSRTLKLATRASSEMGYFSDSTGQVATAEGADIVRMAEVVKTDATKAKASPADLLRAINASNNAKNNRKPPGNQDIVDTLNWVAYQITGKLDDVSVKGREANEFINRMNKSSSPQKKVPYSDFS